MTALEDLLIGDSALLLYFSESRARSQNSTIVYTHFLEFVVIYVCVLLCKLKVFLNIVAVIVRIKEDNCF